MQAVKYRSCHSGGNGEDTQQYADFSYQLRHIGVGTIWAGVRRLERWRHWYSRSGQIQKRKLCLQKGNTVSSDIKLHDLTRRITELTEELEELKTEKELLLRSLDCVDDAGISAVKKEIATMEGALQKLSEQEAKYSAELDEALKQYTELKEQAVGMDAAELMDARLAIREEKERSSCVLPTAKYDPMMMHAANGTWQIAP